MPVTEFRSVQDLALDLANHRTVQQVDEIHAVQTMISISPDRFWALMESLIDDGYLPTENILVLETGKDTPKSIVKEGNRRVAALKLILGYITSNDIELPTQIEKKIKLLTDIWKVDNGRLPCTIYANTESAIVDRIIKLAHGKGEKASKDQWNAVARARHNRDNDNAAEPGLDILEKYIKFGKNLTFEQAKRWSGDYPLSVLDEAIGKIAARLGASTAMDLSNKYPYIKYRDAFDCILLGIGNKEINFNKIRNKQTDFADKYGIPVVAVDSGNGSQNGTAETNTGSASGGTGRYSSSQNAQSGANSNTTAPGSAASRANSSTAAVAIQDPRAVKRTLKKWKLLGNNRQKIVTLRDEACNLDLTKNPLAFCFILRSLFELSAKAYCDDHTTCGGPSYKDKDGKDKKLVSVLRDVTNHLINPPNQGKDKEREKALHGALTELAKSGGILSVRSMNQLVHNPLFSVAPSDICTIFGNIFPLLDAMNR